MKTIWKSASTMALTALICVPSYGQQKKDLYPELEGREPIIINVQGGRAKNEIINIYEVTTRPYFHDPRAPKFILTNRYGNYSLGIGGYVRTVAEYDFDGIVDNVDFITADISVNGPRQNNQFQMDPTTSLLFFKLVGKNRILGNFVVYTDANFRGEGNTFVLRHAYISFRGFTIGKDEGLFMDLAAIPPTIDFEGPNGQAYYRVTQVRYEKNCMWGMKFGIGIEDPNISASYYRNNGTFVTKQAVQRYPNIPAYLQYAWNKNSHIRFGAIFRSMSYLNNNDDVKSKVGWGIQGSTTFNVNKFQVYGQYTYGKGIASFLNDLGTLNVDLVPNYENPNKMQVLPMVGWYAGLQYNFSKKVFCSATYSASNLNSRKEFAANNPNVYKKGQYMVANVFWNVTHDLQVGAEYLHGYKKDFNYEKRNANRINLSAQYSF